jgi:ferritin-like metal-binding protein YciE
MDTLDQLFLQTLKDVFYAERRVLKALPKMAAAAESEALAAAFTSHRTETEGQIERLREVFEALGKRAQGVTCEAINGLIEECDELLEATPAPGAVRDAGLAACGQAVEHYEIARYGSLIAWADAGGRPEVAALLKANLEEEQAAAKLLAQLATRELNKRAAAPA